MNQFLVIIRGAPASGKTTLAKSLRNFDEGIVWLKVDNFKDFFSDEAKLREQKFVDECALSALKYLLNQGFSVVMEKIFYDPFIIPLATNEAQQLGIKVLVFQITCSSKTLLMRDRARPGVKEGCRKPLRKDTIEKIQNHLDETFLPQAIILDTEKFTIEECVNIVRSKLNN